MALLPARSPRLALLALVVVPVASHFIILATRHVPIGLHMSGAGLFKLGFVSVSALTHWAIYAFLLAVFALTLRPGREPLITMLVRRMHGLTPERARYTRQVTIAWSLFFAAQLGISILLFCFAPLTIWSFFANLLDFPLIAAMFAAEYAVRQRVLRDPPRESFAALAAMFSDCFAEARAKLPAADAPAIDG